MIRIFYCFGKRHRNDNPSYFFYAAQVTDEGMKHRQKLTPKEVLKIAGEEIYSLTSLEEDFVYSMLIQKLYDGLPKQQTDSTTRDLLCRAMEGAITLSSRPTQPAIVDPEKDSDTSPPTLAAQLLAQNASG